MEMRSRVVGGGDGEGAGALGLGEAADLEAGGGVQGAGEDEAMADVFAGGAVVAGAEGVELPALGTGVQGADAVDVVEEFAEEAAPGLGFGEAVVGDQGEEAACCPEGGPGARCSWSGCRSGRR